MSAAAAIARPAVAHKYLVEGCCDGNMFAEAISATSPADAERQAINLLCAAWRIDQADVDGLDDLGDVATVRPFMPSDYARHAALEMFDGLARLLPHVRDEIEQRKQGGNDEDWRALDAAYLAAARAFAHAQGGVA